MPGAAGCCRIAGYLPARPHSWSGLSGCRVAGLGCRVAGLKAAGLPGCRGLPGTAGLPGRCRGAAGLVPGQAAGLPGPGLKFSSVQTDSSDTARDPMSPHAWRPAAPRSQSPGSEPNEYEFGLDLLARRPQCSPTRCCAQAIDDASPRSAWIGCVLPPHEELLPSAESRHSPCRKNPRRRSLLSRVRHSCSGRVSGPKG